jgi:hypothetical protein
VANLWVQRSSLDLLRLKVSPRGESLGAASGNSGVQKAIFLLTHHQAIESHHWLALHGATNRKNFLDWVDGKMTVNRDSSMVGSFVTDAQAPDGGNWSVASNWSLSASADQEITESRPLWWILRLGRAGGPTYSKS